MYKKSLAECSRTLQGENIYYKNEKETTFYTKIVIQTYQ